MVDVPCVGQSVELVAEADLALHRAGCPAGAFTNQHNEVAKPTCLLTVSPGVSVGDRPLRREHATVQGTRVSSALPGLVGLARQLATTWRTVWTSITPLLEALLPMSRFYWCDLSWHG